MLTKATMTAIRQHMESEAPHECCGLVVMVGRKQRYIACDNVFTDPSGARSTLDSFAISDRSWMDAEDIGQIVRVIHSHPDQLEPTPSLADIQGCNGSGVVWGIIAKNGEYTEITPVNEPLCGRRFVLGSSDCYGLIMAWHALQGVSLPDFRVPYEWWTRGESLYMDNYEKVGFVECAPDTPGAMVIMQVAAEVPNHAGIYFPGDQLLHHAAGCLSSLTPFKSGYFRDNVVKWARHKDLPETITSWL